LFRSALLFLVLFITWLALSGHYSIFLLISGVVCAGLSTILTLRMNKIDNLPPEVNFTYRLPLFWIWLAKEVTTSAISVAYHILHPKLPINPIIQTISAQQKTDVGLVTYANSITLTPGTLSTNVNKESIEVHALSKNFIESLTDSEMNLKIAKLEKSQETDS